MDKSAIRSLLTRRRASYVAAILGALLAAVAASSPARSGDLAFPPGYGPGYVADRWGPPPCCGVPRCAPCGCNPCGCVRCGGCCVVRRRGVLERHWVEREYFERRYAVGGPHFRAFYGGGYPPYYPGAAWWEAPRPHLGYGGIQYGPAPISYEDGPPPPRPLYDFDPPPRPPIGIPAGYYGGDYAE